MRKVLIASRKRRVKCDETKPECKRCFATKNTCIYEQIEWQTDDQTASSRSSPSSASSVIRIPIAYQPGHAIAPSEVAASRRELQMFDVFRTEIIGGVGSPFDYTFWTTDVLQAASKYPAVWHSCLALGAMHRQRETPFNSRAIKNTKTELYNFALQHYNMSIHKILLLTKQKSHTYAERETLLMTAVLFAGFCSLQQNLQQAIIHATNGVQLFYRWGMRGEAQVAHRKGILDVEHLSALFDCMELQLTNRLGNVNALSTINPDTVPNCSPKEFDVIADAFLELQPLLGSLLQAGFYSGYPAHIPRPAPLTNWFHSGAREWFKFMEKYERFKLDYMAKENPDMGGIKVLDILCLGGSVFIRANLAPDELVWDQFRKDFKWMVDQTEELVAILDYNPVAKETLGPPGFSFSSFRCGILSFIGSYCREFDLRRRIISLLRGSEKQEGLWNSRCIAAICETRMTLEEEAVLREDPDGPIECDCVYGSFICNDHRIAHSELVFDSAGQPNLKLTTVLDSRLGRGGTPIPLHW